MPADKATTAPAKTTPGGNKGEANLVLTGAIEKELTGPIVACGYTYLDGRNQGGTWAIRTDEFDFQVMATSDEDFARPSTILNARVPERISFVHKQGGGTVTAARDRTVATVDATLTNVVGSESVHVKGTMTCPPR